MKINNFFKRFKTRILTAAFILAVAGSGFIIFCHQKHLLPHCFYNSDSFNKEISAAAKKYALPEELVKALILQESKFYPRAIGKDGEIGLMQLHPNGAAAEWARIYKRPRPSNILLAEVNTNLDIGCWYLARAIKRWQHYRHGTELALAEYNAGAANAAKWKPDTPDGEVVPRISWPGTRQYVINIMKNYRRESALRQKKSLP